MKPLLTKISFEQRYLDDSGVEFAVRFDGNDHDNQIEFERVNTIQFPLAQLEWLICCLQRINEEVSPA